MLRSERQKFIMSEITRYNTLTNRWLADELGVSSETIRRDLEEMETRGLLVRVHGGAYLNYENVRETNFVSREHSHPEDKLKIAEKCCEFVHEEQTVALDVSTTNTEVARGLASHFSKLTVLTNSLVIAEELSKKPDFTIIMPGGLLRNTELCFVGESSADYMRRFHTDLFFMSFSGITLKDGITDYGFGEYQLKMAMLANTSVVYAVGDHSKFELASLLKVCPVRRVSAIITDDGLPRKIIDKYESEGLNIFIGDKEPE
ncbi:MAG: DeoR/GlpR family DNA-binding transcription regulator [Sporolactobacillus sp.]